MVLIPNQSERHVEGKYIAPILGGVDVAAGQLGGAGNRRQQRDDIMGHHSRDEHCRDAHGGACVYR
jgi:hypothetical protein